MCNKRQFNGILLQGVQVQVLPLFVVEAKTKYYDIAKDKLNAYKIIDDKKIYHLIELPVVLNKQVA